MRKHFVDTVIEIMKLDANLVFLTADLGFGSFEEIQELFPERFFNVGIAEQNMVGMACGLSLCGKRVIIYSIANFSTLRVIEQIRNYLLYHDCKVLIVNGGGGFSYGQLGYTHYATEDVSVMSSLQTMRVFVPFSKKSVNIAIQKWYAECKVAYLRLEKNDINFQEDLEACNNIFLAGDINCDNYILSYGSIAEYAFNARSYLLSKGINISVIILYQLENFDMLFTDLKKAKRMLIVEENSIRGGFGEHLLASCMQNGIQIDKAKCLGIHDFIHPVIGDQDYMREQHGLSYNSIIKFFEE